MTCSEATIRKLAPAFKAEGKRHGIADGPCRVGDYETPEFRDAYISGYVDGQMVATTNKRKED